MQPCSVGQSSAEYGREQVWAALWSTVAHDTAGGTRSGQVYKLFSNAGLTSELPKALKKSILEILFILGQIPKQG